MRRRLFGRSFDSASTKLDSSSRHSREGSMSISLKGSSASPTIAENGTVKSREKEKEKDKEKEKEKEKKPKKAEGSAGKSAGERLSIFGSTFTGSLGKARKPPPRYPATVEEDTGGDKPSALSLFTVPRLTSGSSRKVSDTPSSIKRPGTSPGKLSTPKAKESRDPALLRKRTSSVPAPPPNLLPNGGPIKPGQSIIEQIGEADFSGWMRKKGDRYNSWKLRYFVLKGPDLYCLRSNNPSVRVSPCTLGFSLLTSGVGDQDQRIREYCGI
ncbi:hypothetical protein H0H93_015469 [Arthromyces matolae]|nr:hypothetical protein H0H93_015469 [Arthromyces matolae]